jgi:hypothetical protein
MSGESRHPVQMKRTEMKRSETRLKRAPLRPRRKGLRRISPEKRAFLDELDAITPALLERSHGVCEILVSAKCHYWGEHRHHVLPVSDGGKNLLTNLLHICLECHDWIHNQHPIEAREAGWLARP